MKVLFYPDKVISYARIRVIFKMIGWEIVEDISKEFDIIFYWNVKTVNKPDNVILRLSEDYPVINIRCNDVSKENVTKIYEKVFGNTLGINPEKYTGRVVAKRNLGQGDKSGKIVNCPCKKEKGWHYQRLLQDISNGQIKEYRAFIVDKVIVVNEKQKKIGNRFHIIVEKNEYKLINEVFTYDEVKKVNEFCKEIGAEYCEIDILRDKELYIIDVNNTSGIGGFEKNYIEIYDKTNQRISKALNKYEKCK